MSWIHYKVNLIYPCRQGWSIKRIVIKLYLSMRCAVERVSKACYFSIFGVKLAIPRLGWRWFLRSLPTEISNSNRKLSSFRQNERATYPIDWPSQRRYIFVRYKTFKQQLPKRINFYPPSVTVNFELVARCLLAEVFESRRYLKFYFDVLISLLTFTL